MGSIDTYIFRTALASFAIVVASLTGVIWVTQALRGIDLMTSQGQTILVFLGFTGLAIPLLVLIVAPIALVIAVAHTLNKLAADSEIIVMNSAGLRPWSLFRPFLYVATVVALLVAVIAFYVAPEGLRRVKKWDTEITFDILANILQPGRFTQLDNKLTVRVRERQAGGLLAGIFVDDRRDPKERITIVAERGTVLKNETGSFLVLEDGTVQRLEAGKLDPAIVAFGRYAFDMSKFASMAQNVSYNVRELTTSELIAPALDSALYKSAPGQFRAELHDRIFAPLYPLVFCALTFAFLGAPRTTRQSRGFSIATAVLAVGLVRIAGFALSVVAVVSPVAILAQYALLATTLAISAWLISGGVVIEPPSSLTETINNLTARMLRRFAAS